MTATTIPNGRSRKTLADQIDRLDRVLDGLAEGLNDAVAAAVREAATEAVREAVHAVLAEVLANQAVLAKLQDLAAPDGLAVKRGDESAPPERIRATWVWALAVPSAVCRALGLLARSVGRSWAVLVRAVGQVYASLRVRVQAVRHFRVQLLRALATGAAVGAAAYVARALAGGRGRCDGGLRHGPGAAGRAPPAAGRRGRWSPLNGNFPAAPAAKSGRRGPGLSRPPLTRASCVGPSPPGTLAWTVSCLSRPGPSVGGKVPRSGRQSEIQSSLVPAAVAYLRPGRPGLASQTSKGRRRTPPAERRAGSGPFL